MTVIGWVAREALTPAVGPTALPFIFFFPTVAVAAWYGGTGPGFVSTVLAAMAATWSFIEPVHTLSITRVFDIAALGSFVVSAAFIVGAMDAMHRVRHRLLQELGELRRAEADIAESKDLLATTLASIGDGVIATDASGNVSFLNAEAERLTGWDSGDATGKALPTIFSIVNEDSRRPSENPVEKVFRLGTVVGLANHTLLLAKDGSEVPIDDSAAPIRRQDGSIVGAVLVFRDVREQRQAQYAKARLAAIVESSTDAVISKSLDGIIQTWNAGAERLLGFRAEEVIGKSITILIPSDKAEDESVIQSHLHAGRPVPPMETVRLTKEGRRLPVLLSASPVKDSDGRVVGASKILHEISDIVAARQAVERERELFATTLASIGDGVIVTDDTGRITFLNPEAERLTGWSLPEARGSELHVVFRIVNEETGRPVEDPVQKVLRLGQVVGLANHTVLMRRDGSSSPIDDSAAPIRIVEGAVSGVVLVFRDITERRKAEESLRENEKRFRLMADAAPVLIWLSGTDKLCTWFNKQWLEFVGRTMEQELGNGWAENVHKDDLARCLEIYAGSFDAKRPFSMEYRLRRNDGEYRWVLDRGVPRYESDGVFSGYIGSCVDVTERIEAERALLAADRRKDEFLAMLSHELRNPLAPIQLAVTMLRKIGPPQRELDELRDIIDRQTKQLARLLDDLLDVSRITSGKIALRKDRVSVSLAIASAVEASRPIIDALGHELEVTLPTEPVEVEGDLNRLAQVISNLLNNAAKYSERGGRISISAERNGTDAVIRVRDTGIGLSADQISRIFVMFAQVNSSIDRGQGGLGVGLALAKRLVELHGGRIEGRSAGLGKGSEFIVRLPALAEPAAARSAMKVERPGLQRKYRVLIADDNKDSAILLEMTLQHAGHDVRTAYDGEAAVQAATSFRPEVVLLDIGMPGLNGYEAARRLRSEFGNSVVLIAVTGWGQDEHKRLASEAGFDHHLIKPVDFGTLDALLGRLSR